MLTLSVDPSSSIGLGSGDVIACPTSNALWASGADQPASQAAPYDCSPGVAVTGNYDSASHTISFDLTSAQEYQAPAGPTGIFSLVLAPGSSPSGPFTAIFDAPGSSSFDITGESPAADGSSVPGGSSGFGSSLGIGTGTGQLGGTSDLPFSLTGAGAGVQPAASSAANPSSALEPSASGSTADVTALPGLTSGSQRTIAVILLVGLGGGLWMAASNTGRRPRSLRRVQGATADPD
jgi:hypothetical protein